MTFVPETFLYKAVDAAPPDQTYLIGAYNPANGTVSPSYISGPDQMTVEQQSRPGLRMYVTTDAEGAPRRQKHRYILVDPESFLIPGRTPSEARENFTAWWDGLRRSDAERAAKPSGRAIAAAGRKEAARKAMKG